jgi:hypothetical protein
MLPAIKIVKASVGLWSTFAAAVLISLSLPSPAVAATASGETPASVEDASKASVADDAAGPGFTRWERVVRGFRREHSFSAAGGYLRGRWIVRSMGTLKDRLVADDGAWSRAEYTYHLQLYEGFGYLLGSTFGATYTRTGDSEPIKPPTSLIYPGLVAGFVYNFSPSVRAAVFGGINLERYDGIKETDGIGDDEKIYVTLESYDLGTAIDIFATLPLGVRLEFHDRYQKYRKPRSSEGKLVNASLERFDRWLGAGIVYHML